MGLTAQAAFPWPAGKRVAVSLSFDDARASQVLSGLDLLQRHGAKATTSAYPCGSKFIGRGVHTQSYVPLVAKRFRAGRGFRDEAANDPAYGDLAQLFGVDSDGMTFEAMKEAVRKAEPQGGWLVFAGHEIGKPGPQTTQAAVLENFLRYAKDPANGIWLDTVETIAGYVQKHRAAP